MPANFKDIVATKQQRRLFIVRGGCGPANIPGFYGLNGEDLWVFTGASVPVNGDRSNINVSDPRRQKSFKRVASSVSAPDRVAGVLECYEPNDKLGFAWKNNLRCPLTILEVGNNGCKDLSNLNLGWATLIYWGGGFPGSVDAGDRTHFEDDDAVVDGIDYTFDYAYGIGALPLGQAPVATLVRAVNDVTYATVERCAGCGPSNDGATWLYGIMVGAAAAKPALVYSTDGGGTWTATDVTPAANNELPVAIRWMPSSNRLFVLSPQTNGAYYLVDINPATGAPAGYTGVTTGFLASGAPADVYIYNDQAYICGALGGIQKVATMGSDPVLLATVGAATWARIDGDDNGFIAVLAGANRTVGYSPNSGKNWTTTTATPGAAGTGTALEVIDDQTLFVGLSSGEVYYTLDRGESWTKIATGISFTAISDIKFATREVGYIAGTVGSAQALATTFDGGRTWSLAGATNPHINNVPASIGSFRRLAVPEGTLPVTVANALAIAGTATGGTAGYVAVGKMD